MVTVLIPAYNPDHRLAAFVDELRRTGQFRHIVVVDDGSHEDRQPLFARLKALPGVTVLRQTVNLGKGAALKTGMYHVCASNPHGSGVVTADADGQHLAADVVRVARRLEQSPDSLILGSRQFSGRIPFRSRLGNRVTKYAFWAVAGRKLEDTQSGLRGIPLDLARQLLRLRNCGYEFELDMLMHCKKASISIIEVPIAAVYLDGNASSHFNPILDSLKIYFVFMRFIAASLLTAAIDYCIFIPLYCLLASLLPAQFTARIIAAGINFFLVRRAVFRSRAHLFRALAQYSLLVIGMGVVSYSVIRLLAGAFGWNVFAAKIASELLVYLANFAIQRDIIFADTRRENDAVVGMTRLIVSTEGFPERCGGCTTLGEPTEPCRIPQWTLSKPFTLDEASEDFVTNRSPRNSSTRCSPRR